MGNATISSAPPGSNKLESTLQQVNITMGRLQQDVNTLKRAHSGDYLDSQPLNKQAKVGQVDELISTDESSNDELDQFLQASQGAPDGDDEWLQLSDFSNRMMTLVRKLMTL
ncbi:hypothetical protein DPMN_152109 [Dreissena polymorpha]|uniref:Uncharacterized protein n=1 Tax=Dreissena polymorpha TaxID=45954 RepID=A0A9D4FIX8_DREPO|nr:hypothetical protein DPMN_152109 [Dreissena polymorpha]